MSAITSTESWFRGQDMEKAFQGKYEYSSEPFGELFLGAIVGGCLGLLSSPIFAKIDRQSPSPDVELKIGLSALSGVIIGLIAASVLSYYASECKRDRNQKMDALTKKIPSFEIVSGKDLAYLLEDCTQKVRDAVIPRLHSAQISSARKYLTNQAALRKMPLTGQADEASIQCRINLENTHLNDLLNKICCHQGAANDAVLQSLTNCSLLLPDELIADFLAYNLNINNVKNVHQFAINHSTFSELHKRTLHFTQTNYIKIGTMNFLST